MFLVLLVRPLWPLHYAHKLTWIDRDLSTDLKTSGVIFMSKSNRLITIFLAMLTSTSNITAQIWENMKANCGLDAVITPANDFSNALE